MSTQVEVNNIAHDFITLPAIQSVYRDGPDLHCHAIWALDLVYADVISNVIWEIERWPRHGNWYETIIYWTGCKFWVCVRMEEGWWSWYNGNKKQWSRPEKLFVRYLLRKIQLFFALIQHYFFEIFKCQKYDRGFQTFWCQIWWSPF